MSIKKTTHRFAAAVSTLALCTALATVGCGARTELPIGAGGAMDSTASSTSTSCDPLASGSSPSSGACGANLGTDPTNCGACGHDCLGGDCVGGMCQPVVVFSAATHDIGCLAIDADNLYWEEDQAGSDCQIMKMPLTGGAPIVLASSVSNCAGMTVDDTHVYWTTWYSAGLVMKVPKAGGPAVVLASVDPAHATGIAVDTAFAYWTDMENVNLHKVPLDGGADQIIGEGATSGLGLVVSGGFVNWLDFTSGKVRRMPTTGGTATVLPTGLWSAYGLAVDATQFYWNTETQVWQMPIGGGKPILLADGGDAEWAGIAVDCRYVYVVDHLAGTVVKVPIGGGPPITIASGQSFPWALVQSPEALYWSSPTSIVSNSGAITKLAK